MELSGTPVFWEKKGRRRETSTATPAPGSRNQEIHDGTDSFSWGKKEERRRQTSTGTPAGTRRNQQIMMEQNPFPEERKRKKREEGRQAPEPKKREEGKQAPEPEPEPRGTSKSWWNKTPFLRKGRREKKGDKHRNPSRNQEEPANHDETKPLSWGKEEERRRETSTGTRAGTKRNQQIMMKQNPFPEERKKRRRETSTGTRAGTKRNQRIMMEQNPFPEERKMREEGRQAPEPQPEPGRTSRSWWNRTPFLSKERREKKGDKHRNPGRNQEEPANHDGTEPLSWAKKEERRETSTGTPAGTRRSQQIMREQRPFLARIENPIQLKSCLGNWLQMDNRIPYCLLPYFGVFFSMFIMFHHVHWFLHFFPSSLKGPRWSAAATWRRCGVRRLSATTWAQWLKRDGSLDGFSLPQHFANKYTKLYTANMHICCMIYV